MKINKLISTQQRVEHLLNTGNPINEARRSGRSTALALHFISKAMLTPGLVVQIVDHYDNTQVHQMLGMYIAKSIQDLKLEHFCVDYKKLKPTITYEVFRIVPSD